jgi:hypothetical protein
MATTKTFKIPTMIVNGTPTEVGLPEWANIALSGSELTSYLAADARQGALLEAFKANAAYQYNDVTDGSGNIVGVNVITTSDIPNDTEWLSFWDRFQADPAVTFPTDFETITNS